MIEFKLHLHLQSPVGKLTTNTRGAGDGSTTVLPVTNGVSVDTSISI